MICISRVPTPSSGLERISRPAAQSPSHKLSIISSTLRELVVSENIEYKIKEMFHSFLFSYRLHRWESAHLGSLWWDSGGPHPYSAPWSIYKVDIILIWIFLWIFHKSNECLGTLSGFVSGAESLPITLEPLRYPRKKKNIRKTTK